MPGEVQEPDDAPGGEPEDTEEDSEEYPEEEETGPVEAPAPDRDEEENPDVDAGEFPEEYAGEDSLSDADETPPPSHRDTREPGTDELLEHYGAEYGEDETLGSLRKPNSRTPTIRTPKPEAFDDALFTSQRKPRAPPNSRGNTTRIIGGILVLIAMVAVAYFIGLPMLAGNGGAATITPPPEPTIARTPVPTQTATPVPVPGALVPQATQLMPADLKFFFQVQKSPITSRILVAFAGSAGFGSISSADVRVTHRDGSVATGTILPLKGITEVILNGTNDPDRVEIIALMTDGRTYRVYDELVP